MAQVAKAPAKKKAMTATGPPEFQIPTRIEAKEWMIRQCLTKAAHENLYEVIVPLLDKTTRERIGLRLALPFYAQDPLVAGSYPALRPEEMLKARPRLSVDWEPELTHGPTSARLAVVDFNGDTGTLSEPARWSPEAWAFTNPDGTPIPPSAPHSCSFHQVNLWFTAQSVLEFFEDPWALGRPVPWAFRGNRLILVPHAGWGTNAFYDRHSKSLQFYCFGNASNPGYTCLSHDVIAHETGHAVLDGIRPLYLENSSQQTAAFHEFVADLTALLTALRNNVARAILAKKEKEGPGQLEKGSFVDGLAAELAQYMGGRRYLRSAVSELNMADLGPEDSPHHCSQVLTAAMYDILCGIARKHLGTEPSYSKALWWATDRFRRIALQPLDYLPPADIQFVDYARAVLRSYALVSSRDSQGYGELMREVFHRRLLCSRPWEDCKKGDSCELDSEQPPDGLRLRHDIESIAGSPCGAYYFLHDNRRRLGIPNDQDVEVVDLYQTSKWDVGRGRLPTEVVLEYIWREPVALDDRSHGYLRGRNATLICGGTLVFDGRGNIVSWARKHGRADERGDLRRERLQGHVARLIEAGAVALLEEREAAALGLMGPPVIARETEFGLSFEATPQLRDRESKVHGELSRSQGAEIEKESFESRYGAEPWTTSF